MINQLLASRSSKLFTISQPTHSTSENQLLHHSIQQPQFSPAAFPSTVLPAGWLLVTNLWKIPAASPALRREHRSAPVPLAVSSRRFSFFGFRIQRLQRLQRLPMPIDGFEGRHGGLEPGFFGGWELVDHGRR